MPLAAQLFQNDAKLEAAATSDPAHIQQGAKGEHVQKIQLALVAIDGAAIETDGVFGPATSGAVLTYKKRRNIINRSYQTQPDAIVGKMTMAALDRDMVELENSPSGRGECQCTEFPRDSSSTRTSAFAATAVPVRAVLTGSPQVQALGRVPLAKLWVARAREFIRLGKAQILSGLPIDEFKETQPRKALVTHFKINQIPNPVNHLIVLDNIYILIGRTLASASTIFIDDPATRAFGTAHLGGFFNQSDPVRGKIRFGTPFAGKGELFQTSVLIHEGAHYVSRVIDHFASELPAPNGTPVDSSTGVVHTKTYAQLSFQEAAGNAYTYAQFALHAFKNFDKRIVPFAE